MMKKFFVSLMAVATMIAATSCEDPQNEEVIDKTVSVSATLENGRAWAHGAEVVINNAKYTIVEGGSSTVTIDKVAKADIYCGAYDFGNGTIESTTLTMEVPAIQGPAIKTIQPMIASNTEPNLVFKNLFGTLKVAVEGEGTITKMVLTSSDTALAGPATAEMNYSGAPQLNIADSGLRSVTVDLGAGVSLPADITLSLPARTYSGFVATLYGKGDEIMSGKQLSAVEILRGEVVETKITYIPDAEPPTYITVTLEDDADGVANVWTAQSVVYINGTPAQLVGGEGSGVGEFGPISSASTYLVTNSSASVNGVSGDVIRLSIPASQSYGSILSRINPAVGKSTSKEVVINYLAGVLDINVEGPHAIRRAVLAGKNNRRLAGNGVADLSTATARLSLNSDASREVVVDCGTAGVSIESGVTFRFVIPAEEYTEGFTLTLEDVGGQTFSAELGATTVVRNSVVTYSERILWENAMGDDNNLSKMGYSNCYMVHMEGKYGFDTRLVDGTPINNIAKVDWLWVSKVEGKEGNALISDIKYADGYVTFNASAEEGNALLAAFDADGNIVWSWHIWMTDMPEVYDYQNNGVPMSGGLTDGYYCMDRNLGATAPGYDGYENFGLYYQWGRKDPFIGDTAEERKRDTQAGGWMNVVEPFGNSSQITVCNSAYSQAEWVSTPSSSEIGTIDYATAHPMTFLAADPNKNKANWLDVNSLGAMKNDVIYDPDKSLWRPFQKSNYDPCPAGYQIPRKAMWVYLDSHNSVQTEYKGFVNTAPDGSESYFPSAGYRSAHPSDAGALMSVQNDSGFVKIWSSEMDVAESAYCFTYNYPLYNAGQGATWGNGYNVRCVKAYN